MTRVEELKYAWKKVNETLELAERIKKDAAELTEAAEQVCTSISCLYYAELNKIQKENSDDQASS